MKNLIIAATCILSITGVPVIAQSTGTNSTLTSPANIGPANAQAKAKQAIQAQDILNQYSVKYRNSGVEGRNLLESAHALGVAKTAENVNAVRSMFASRVTNDEKVLLARILGSFYTYDNQTGQNDGIAKDLRSAVYSGQKDVARAATLAYSRLGYFPDYNDVLLHAQKNGYIEKDEYYGELAHLLRFAPANEQFNIVSKINDDKNSYAVQILAFITHDADAMKQIYPETKKLIQTCLEKHEPGFSQAIGEFSYTDSVRYAMWLHSIAMLNSATTNAQYSDVIFSRLNNQTTDPRKIMSYLASSDGKELIIKIGQRGPFQNALQRIQLYTKQLPQNTVMRDMVQDVAATISSVKP